MAAEGLVSLVKSQALRIAKLEHQLAGLRRHRFGSTSESLDQLQLGLEDEEIAAAQRTARIRSPMSGTSGPGTALIRPPPAIGSPSTARASTRHDIWPATKGWIHADGYAGFNELYRSGGVREVACLAHIRRKFVDVFQAEGSLIAEEAIKRIAGLYA